MILYPTCRVVLQGISSLLLFTIGCLSAIAAPRVDGLIIVLPDDGWYQVQRADNYETVCEGLQKCDVGPGRYIVINHTTGERFESVEVQADNSPTTPGISVVGNQINLPADDWYQVQNATTYESVCEGTIKCTVDDGTYTVINHTSGVRTDGIIVGTVPVASNATIKVSGNTLSWPDDGWYQVQSASTSTTICEGGQSCTVPNGTYIVVNHTNGMRYEYISVVSAAPKPESDLTQTLKLSAAPNLPPLCVGTIDQDDNLFCVNPKTRLLSAKLADGSLWWSFTLPGDNDSNEIESVLSTDRWLVLIADRYPTAEKLTPTERANQYEASIFEKNGAFVRTVPLKFVLNWTGSSDAQLINYVRVDGPRGTPVTAVAFESDDDNLKLIVGWNRWRLLSRQNGPWDSSGMTLFDLTNGTIEITQHFAEQGINEIKLAQSGHDIARIVTTEAVLWRTTENLSPVGASYFTDINRQSLVSAPSKSQSQLNGNNYREVIDRVLPWINADVPAEIMYGPNMSTLPGARYPFPNDEFALLDEYEDETSTYSNTLYECSNGGQLLRQQYRFSSIYHNQLDQCRLFDGNYSGMLREDYVGRDGYTTSANRLSVHRDNGATLNGTFFYSYGNSRVLRGASRGFTGDFTVYNKLDGGTSEAITNYRSLARFFHGRSIGAATTCYSNYEDMASVKIVSCVEYLVDGSISADFTINADWSSYSDLKVDTALSFGKNYYLDFEWYASDDAPAPDPLPISLPTSAPTKFFFSDGSIEITAADESRIVLSPLGADQHPLMQVTVFDKFGNQAGNFAPESIDVKCEERLSACVLK